MLEILLRLLTNDHGIEPVIQTRRRVIANHVWEVAIVTYNSMTFLLLLTKHTHVRIRTRTYTIHT